MASISEKYEGRVGSSRSLAGQTLNRLIFVTMDDIDDDPLEVLESFVAFGSFKLFKTVGTTTGVSRRGNTIHWPAVSQLTNTTIQERMNPLVYLVALTYTPLSSVSLQRDPLLVGWELSMRSVSISEEVAIQTTGEPLGQRVYKKVDTENEASAYVNIGGAKQYLALASSDNKDRVAKTRTRDVNGAVMVLSREVPAFNVAVGAILQGARGDANSLPFFGAGPGLVRFTDFSITISPSGSRTRTVETSNTLGQGSSVITGISYTVVMEFLGTKNRQQPELQFPTWLDPDTSERKVLRNTSLQIVTDIAGDELGRSQADEKVLDFVNVHEVSDLNSLLATVTSA